MWVVAVRAKSTRFEPSGSKTSESQTLHRSSSLGSSWFTDTTLRRDHPGRHAQRLARVDHGAGQWFNLKRSPPSRGPPSRSESEPSPVTSSQAQ
eukprot:2777752-Rhodomonas_salina.1